jgi:Peptidase family C50
VLLQFRCSLLADHLESNTLSFPCPSIAGDVLYGDSVTVAFKNAFLPFYEEAIRRAAEIDSVTSLDPVTLPKQAEGCLGLALAKQVELRKARLLMESTSTLDDDARMNIRGICHDIKDSAVSCSADKAWALYYLGLFELEKARRLGTLQKIWTQDDPARDDSTCNHLRMAKSYLSQASLHTMNASDVLTRNILRSLALASGPAMEDSIGMSSGVLVLTSVGQSLRRRMTWSFSNGNDHNAENEDENRWKNIFSAFDGPSCEDGERDARIADFLKQIAILTPSGWSFVATVICPTGEILVTSLEKIASKVEFTISTRCIFASDEMTAYDCIMKPLDTILKSMQEQLHRLDPAAVAESSDKEAIKKTWWEERGRLDENLGSLLCQVEATFFSQVFDHRGAGSTIFDEDNEVPIGNLASRFDAALDGDASSWETNCLEDRLDNLKALTIAKLKEKLIMMGVDESLFKKLKKAQLIELLIEQEDTRNGQKPIAENRFDKESEVVDDCVFLILDENLHRFPFEGMPSFENRTVCRVPCLSFVLATLYELGVDEGNSPSVNPSRTTYILDPEENLMGTRSRLLPAIDSAEASGNWDWNGVVGEVPTVDVFQQGLATKDGLMLYFGHGGGQSCFSRRRIEELIDHRVQALHGLEGEGRCQASVVLMGCSSGRLVSINRKNSDSVEETPLYYEPEGIALSYLCAGAPCVIGNLWDVTDNDIDR